MKFELSLIHISKSFKLPEQIKNNEEGNKLFGVSPQTNYCKKIPTFILLKNN
jgi:hypothetical protein